VGREIFLTSIDRDGKCVVNDFRRSLPIRNEENDDDELVNLRPYSGLSQSKFEDNPYRAC